MSKLPHITIHRNPALDLNSSELERWEERYSSGCSPGGGEVSPWLKDLEFHLPNRGRALDIACGSGRHALWLLSRGCRVHAVDISLAGLQLLQQEAGSREYHGQLYLEQADLHRWEPPPNQYDLIVVVRYLNRALWPVLERALVSGGVLAMRSFHTDILRIRPHFHPEYLLQPGELLAAFREWRILAYEERRWYDAHSTSADCTSSILLRKVMHMEPGSL